MNDDHIRAHDLADAPGLDMLVEEDDVSTPTSAEWTRAECSNDEEGEQ